MIDQIYFGWKKTILYDFKIWWWIISNPYNTHVSDHFFTRISSIEPEQTFAKHYKEEWEVKE